VQCKELLKKLVEIPSVSGNEAKISSFLYEHLKENGLPAKQYKGNVYCSIGKGKQTLLFNSHLDTVPECPGWSQDPFKPKEANGKIYGLGANDAKGSLTAMVDAFKKLAGSNDFNGKLFLAASTQEETDNIGIKQVVEKIPKVDAVVIGEPTNLSICTAMRGLAILKFVAKGKSGHASRPSEGVNAIYKAFQDIEKLKALSFEKEHPKLGKPTVTVTMINGGTKNNVIPGECEFTADVRSTPIYDNQKMIEAIKKVVSSELHILSQELCPKETSESEKIVLAAKKASPGSNLIGFPAMCDWVFVDAPGIIIGPGITTQSHAPNENIEIKQVEKASETYKKIAYEFFK